MAFASFDPNSVTKIYLGRDRICRCGCAGEYVNKGESKFELRLKRFMKMASDYAPAEGDVDASYLNVSYGKDRALTVYFD